jgi:2,5-diketo-D-gluconate reductase B
MDPGDSPTLTSPAMTQLGLIIGTAAYMSPEQAKGRGSEGMIADVNGIPALGLGTWLLHGDEGLDAIVAGLEVGYRHLDTAQTYGTERHIGRAIRASGLHRDEVFVTTKVADTNLARKDFLPSLQRSLDTIDVGAVDLTLIHWPVSADVVPLSSYLEDLADAKARGMTRMIGVSNFPCAWIHRAVVELGAGAIATNQVEVHPYLQNRTLRACCAAHGIAVTAYKPLADGRVARDPVLGPIAVRHGVSAPAVALAWLMRRGLVAIPASGNREHMAANLRATDVRLTDADLAAIDALDRGERLINPAKSPRWD